MLLLTKRSRSALILGAALFCAPASAQSTRALLNTFNNTNFTANGVGAITGAKLNAGLSNLVTSCGILPDTNAWTGANTFSGSTTFSGDVNLIGLPTYSGTGAAPVPTGSLFWNNGLLTKAQ